MKIFYLIALVLLTNTSCLGQICVGDPGKVTWTAWQDVYTAYVEDLKAEEFYPNNPDVSATIYKLQSPINYDNDLGGRIIGFISVPGDDEVVFNVTGDDRTRFYLSDGPDPANISLRAFADGWSQVAEHDKYPSQTSDPILLQSGTFYYFELIYVEGGGGDHISLYWKTDHEDPLNWNLINANYINQADCLPSACPERGLPCDDGNSMTTDDMEDGHCHCVGVPDTGNTCVGERAKVTAYLYDSIPGNNLADLYNDPDFPGIPYTSYDLDFFSLFYQNEVDSVGSLIQAYLSVPVTGAYKFNVTGNNTCKVFLSNDDNPANKEDNEISILWATNVAEHDKFPEQTSGTMNLVAGQYYYVELHQKEGSQSEHFSLFWDTPYTEGWKRIPEMYIYDYTCEIACIPVGTSCDDGDSFTNNDVYDANCDCIGTPCTGSDCDDPLASYTPYAKCNTTDQLDNNESNNWLSCSTQASPNSLRPASHWIHYDLGQPYLISQSHVWNYNVSGSTAQGFEMVAIDYSLDGLVWMELGTYTFTLADGSPDYGGFVGPDFMGITAKHILITSLDGGACRGLGKVVFNATFCPNYGEPCNDGIIGTLNDMIDENCNCTGTPLGLNDCVVDSLLLGSTLISSDTLSAVEHILSSNTIENNSMVYYIAGNDIVLEGGFEVSSGTVFYATIETCAEPLIPIEPPLLKRAKQMEEEDILHVLAKPDSDIQLIEYHVLQKGRYRLDILGDNGELLFNIFEHEIQNRGIYHKRIRTKKLESGVYRVLLSGPHGKELEKMIVL